MRRVARQGGALVARIAAVCWGVLVAGLRWLAKVHVLLPHLGHALMLNRRVRRATSNQFQDAHDRAARIDVVDVDAAVALWQFETDRLNGLATKAAAILAADALVGAGLATQTDSTGGARVACIVSIVYLVSATVAACLAQVPKERQTVSPEDVAEGQAARRMVEVVIANEPLNTELQNLVYVSVRDTFASLVAFVVALALTLLC